MKDINWKKVSVLAARTADDKKAQDIQVVDLGGYSSLADFAVIATINSSPQLEAVEEEINKKLKEQDIRRVHSDGRKSKTWRVYDYGGFFLHLITAQERDFYGLDKVYHFAKPVKWQKPKKAVKKAAKPKKTASSKAKKAKTTAKKTVKKTVKKAKTAAKKTVKKTVKKTKVAKPKIKKTAKKAGRKTAVKKLAK